MKAKLKTCVFFFTPFFDLSWVVVNPNEENNCTSDLTTTLYVYF